MALKDTDILMIEDPSDGKLYQTTVAEINALGGGGGASVEIGDTPPTSPEPGDLWYDTVNGKLFVWYDDGNTTQWVVSVPCCAEEVTAKSMGGLIKDNNDAFSLDLTNLNKK